MTIATTSITTQTTEMLDVPSASPTRSTTAERARRATDRRILTPIRGLYRTAIAGLVIPIVFYLIMTIAIATQWPGIGQLGSQNIIAFVGLIVHPALLAMLIWQRRRFFRLSPRWGYIVSLSTWYWAMIPMAAVVVSMLWAMAVSQYV